MAKDYNNENRFSLWKRDEGPCGFSGVINVGGDEYGLKFLRLAKEGAKGALVVEDREDNYRTVGFGFLYPSKFEEQFLSGKVEVNGAEYYVNLYKNDRGGEKAPTFSGNIKPAEGGSRKGKSKKSNSGGGDEW